jgi:hypothetical protein
MSDHTDCDGCGQRITPGTLERWTINHETLARRVGDRENYPLDACSVDCLTEVAWKIRNERTEVPG